MEEGEAEMGKRRKKRTVSADAGVGGEALTYAARSVSATLAMLADVPWGSFEYEHANEAFYMLHQVLENPEVMM